MAPNIVRMYIAARAIGVGVSQQESGYIQCFVAMDVHVELKSGCGPGAGLNDGFEGRGGVFTTPALPRLPAREGYPPPWS